MLADVTHELEAVSGFRPRAERLVELVVPMLADSATVEIAGRGVRREVVAASPPAGDDDATTDGRLELPLLVDGGGVHPILTARMLGGRVFGDSETALLQSLAERAGLALESARLFDRERHIAETLKESLQPVPLPETPGLDVCAAYLPADEGYGVSGDFYEMVPASDGWFAVIGDVCGKGPRAAGLTALARHSIRAIVLHDPAVSPSRIVSVLNEAFMEQAGSLFATIQIARVVTTGAGRVAVQLCSAGHPPALHRRGEVVSSRSSRDALVGARRGLPYHDIEIELEPGDSLTLYTDGITEAGRPAELFGQQRLIDAIAGARDDAEGIVEAIERAVRSYQVGALKDDIAILCLRSNGL
jgi:serine phosphatase RsbU (regulator of sigma subunit)